MNYNDFHYGAVSHNRDLEMQAAFPVLMRKVYTWMTLAMVLTGLTAYGVATSPGILTALYSNSGIFWGLVIFFVCVFIMGVCAIQKTTQRDNV